MDDEKLLPIGEPVPGHFHLKNKLSPSPASALPAEPAQSSSESVSPLPAPADLPKSALPGVPSPAQQSWGAVISIVIIVLMVIIGAFYAWGQRISQNQPPAAVTQ